MTPRVSMAADPLLVDAYQNLGADGFRVGHLAISWAGIERSRILRDWTPLDLQVVRAHQRGMKLSVLLEILHGGEPEAPRWLWSDFPDWQNPELATNFVRFLHELRGRAGDTIGFLWLGEGPDRYADIYVDEAEAMVSFLAMAGDSARRIFPEARIGIMASPATIAQNGHGDVVRALRDSLGIVGLSLYPRASDIPEEPFNPQTALVQLEDAIAPWIDRPFAVLEAGYPSGAAVQSSEEDQAVFASLLAGWLDSRPPTLELFCWSPLHDPEPALADSLALRRYPREPEARADFAARLASTALRRNDGTPKPARQRFYEERP